MWQICVPCSETYEKNSIDPCMRLPQPQAQLQAPTAPHLLFRPEDPPNSSHSSHRDDHLHRRMQLAPLRREEDRLLVHGPCSEVLLPPHRRPLPVPPSPSKRITARLWLNP